MSRGNGTEDRITPVEIPVASRAKRMTMGNGIRVKWTTLVALIGLLTFVAGGVVFIWKASTAFGGKAEAKDVRKLEKKHFEDVHRVEMGVYEVRMEQRILLDKVAPEAMLAPLPPAPKLELPEE